MAQGSLGGHADGLAQRGVRVNGVTDVPGICS